MLATNKLVVDSRLTKVGSTSKFITLLGLLSIKVKRIDGVSEKK